MAPCCSLRHRCSGRRKAASIRLPLALSGWLSGCGALVLRDGPALQMAAVSFDRDHLEWPGHAPPLQQPWRSPLVVVGVALGSATLAITFWASGVKKGHRCQTLLPSYRLVGALRHHRRGQTRARLRVAEDGGAEA